MAESPLGPAVGCRPLLARLRRRSFPEKLQRFPLLQTPLPAMSRCGAVSNRSAEVASSNLAVNSLFHASISYSFALFHRPPLPIFLSLSLPASPLAVPICSSVFDESKRRHCEVIVRIAGAQCFLLPRWKARRTPWRRFHLEGELRPLVEPPVRPPRPAPDRSRGNVCM